MNCERTTPRASCRLPASGRLCRRLAVRFTWRGYLRRLTGDGVPGELVQRKLRQQFLWHGVAEDPIIPFAAEQHVVACSADEDVVAGGLSDFGTHGCGRGRLFLNRGRDRLVARDRRALNRLGVIAGV